MACVRPRREEERSPPPGLVPPPDEAPLVVAFVLAFTGDRGSTYCTPTGVLAVNTQGYSSCYGNGVLYIKVVTSMALTTAPTALPSPMPTAKPTAKQTALPSPKPTDYPKPLSHAHFPSHAYTQNKAIRLCPLSLQVRIRRQQATTNCRRTARTMVRGTA